MLEFILIGLLLIVVTVTIHASGTTLWMRFLLRRYSAHDGMWKPRDRWQVFVFTSVVLLALHFFEIFLWALTYLCLSAITQLQTLEHALYFSLITFTTLGYGDITLGPDSRILSGIEAMNGILLFGWSTAFFFSVIQRSWKMSFISEHSQGKHSKDKGS